MKRRVFVGALLAAPFGARSAAALAAVRLRAVVGDPHLVERWSWAMGQAVRLRLFGPDEALGLEAAQAVFAELRRVESLLSIFAEASALSELNRRAGRGAWRAPPELLALLESAGRLRVATGGAFDVAVEPLMRIWGFHARRRRPPEPAEVAEASEAVRAAEVRLGPGTVQLPAAHTRLDFGGIGVGYGLDRAAAVLRAHAVGSAMLEMSGDVLALGHPPGASGWSVDIPGAGARGGRATVSLRDAVIATSAPRGTVVRLGTVERGHLMDPRDGLAEPTVRQATVVATSGLWADALSTAAAVSGRRPRGTRRCWLVL